MLKTLSYFVLIINFKSVQWCSYPFSTNNRWEDLTAVLEADVESPIGGHPRDEGDDDADLGQDNRNVDKVFV